METRQNTSFAANQSTDLHTAKSTIDFVMYLRRHSQMLIQLNPPLPVNTPRGKALAQILIDYGAEHDLIWVCFQQDTGEIWCWKNQDVRAERNITFGRDPDER